MRQQTTRISPEDISRQLQYCREVAALSAARPALPCLADLLDDALHIPLVFFPEVEWLSTGIVTAPVMPKQLKAMTKFLRQLEDGGPCLSPRALQRLRDGLAAVQP